MVRPPKSKQQKHLSTAKAGENRWKKPEDPSPVVKPVPKLIVAVSRKLQAVKEKLKNKQCVMTIARSAKLKKQHRQVSKT